MAKLIAGKYEIIGKVGQGGMGSVYKARHTGLETIVALKQLPADLAQDPDLVARFMREAQVMARLRHDNIVKVSDILQEGKLYYLVEDFVDGQDLRQYLQSRGPLPPVEAIEIACQVARALAYAHSRGVIHRDIKPNNILLENTLPVRALLADFGIAKVEDAGDSTVTGTYLGSPKYSAPEQIGYGRKKGERPRIDGRTDVFSLGLVIYEMCEGRQFFADMEPYEIIGRVVYDAEPLVPHFTRPVPARLTAVLTRAISRDPTERYQSMAELLGELEGCGRELFDEDGATVAVRQPTADGSVSDRELEEQIRALERERQRRLALSAQAAARAAREEAAAAGADEVAVALFRQALLREQEGSAALRESVYLRARDLLEQAEGAFKEAASEAAGAQAVREAEAARLGMSEAKALAEREEASAYAGTLYRRAQGLEEEANRAWERQAPVEARQRYAAAQGLYQEARENALSARQRGTAEQAQAAVAAVRAAAQDAGAPEWAAALWQEARGQEDRAASLLTGGHFTDSQELFRAAGSTFERAAAQAAREQAAARERERERAEAARAQATEAAGTAERVGDTAPGTTEAMERARTAFGAAERYFQVGDYAEALRMFQQAQQLFGAIAAAARQEAERLAAEAAEDERRRNEAEEARQGCEQAAGNVEHAARFAPVLAQQAQSAFERGGQLFRTADHAGAKRAFEEARALFVEAVSVASQARQREIDEAVAAQRMAEEAAGEAKRLAGSRGVPATFEEARQQAAAAEVAFKREEFSAARQGFLESAARFREAAAEAVRIHEDVTIIHTDEMRVRGVAGQVPTPGKLVDDVDKTEIGHPQPDRGTAVVRQEPESPSVEVAPAQGAEAIPAADGTAVSRAEAVWPATSFEAEEGEADEGGAKRDGVGTVTEPPRKRRLLAPLGVGAGLAAAALVAVLVYVNRPPRETGVLSPEKPIAEPKPAADAKRVEEVPSAVLAWAVAVPAESEVEVAEDRQLAFAVEVANAETFPGLRYVWHVDGVEQGQGPRWEYTPGFDVSGPGPEPVRKEIKVVALSGDQASEKTWDVHVVDTNRPPAIESASPPEAVVKLTTGEKREFSVTAVDPDTAQGDRLTVTWEYDGKIVGQGPSWLLQESQSGDKELRAIVTDVARAATPAQVWSLEVAPPANRPPRIVRRKPRSRELAVKEGETVSLSVQAQDPDNGDRLEYRWSLAGRPIDGTGASRRFTVPAGSDKYRVHVEVVDTHKAKDQANWDLIVARAEPPIPPPPPTVQEPAPPPKVAKLEISEAEVREWLKNYEHAYDTKKAFALIPLGALKTQNQAKRLQGIFDKYDKIDTEVESLKINFSPSRERVDVTFATRITDLSTGKSNVTPKVTYRLKKSAEGTLVGSR